MIHGAIRLKRREGLQDGKRWIEQSAGKKLEEGSVRQ